MKTETTKITLRLPPDLGQKLKIEAADNYRSLNSEIIARLRASLTGYRRF